MKFLKAALVSTVLVVSSFANATLIDFDGFSSGVFNSGTEDGFTIIVDAGSTLGTSGLYLGPFDGVNSLHHLDPMQSGVTLENGGLFTFASLQTGSIFGDAGLMTLTGSLSGGVVGVDTFSPLNGFYSLLSAVNLAGITIDSLHIDMGTAIAGPVHIDSIVLETYSTSVPEPSTLAIFALGLIGLSSRRFNK